MKQNYAERFAALPTTPLNKMRILVSNDDGIYAPGLSVLEEIARSLSDDVWVVAPETEQSGAGHSLTINDPLRIRQIEKDRYAVNGTPTDCVLLAVKSVFADTKKPDLVLSGVNRGSNLGEDVTYSGTIAAAMEGTLLDIPSIALSQSLKDYDVIPWDVAKVHAATVIQALCKAGWPPNVLMNVNFPCRDADKVKGVKLAPHGRRKIGDKLARNKDPKGRPYYWIGAERNDESEWPGSDINAVKDGYITVTPLSMDLTEYKVMEAIRESFEVEPVALDGVKAA